MPNKEKFEEFEDYFILNVWCQSCWRQGTFKDETRADCYWSADMEGWEGLDQDGEWLCPTCNEGINMDRQEIYDHQQAEYEKALLTIAEDIDEEEDEEEDEDWDDEDEDWDDEDEDWEDDDWEDDEDLDEEGEEDFNHTRIQEQYEEDKG